VCVPGSERAAADERGHDVAHRCAREIASPANGRTGSTLAKALEGLMRMPAA
jgi:hypothetical protein